MTSRGNEKPRNDGAPFSDHNPFLEPSFSRVKGSMEIRRESKYFKKNQYANLDYKQNQKLNREEEGRLRQ